MNVKEKKILDVAFNLFSKYGYKGTPTRLIAEKANLNELTIFRCFKNKQNLFESVLKYYNTEEDVLEFFTEYLNDDLEETINRIPIAYYYHLKNNTKIFKLLIKEPDSVKETFGNSNGIKKILTKYLEAHTNFVGDAESTAIYLLSLGMGYYIFDLYSENIVNTKKISEILECSKDISFNLSLLQDEVSKQIN